MPLYTATHAINTAGWLNATSLNLILRYIWAQICRFAKTATVNDVITLLYLVVIYFCRNQESTF